MTGPSRSAEELAAATAADRQTYLADGLRGVECGRCGTGALVVKHSIAHTSIQWTPGGQRHCSAFDVRTGCAHLRRSIDDAVAAGLVHVPRD